MAEETPQTETDIESLRRELEELRGENLSLKARTEVAESGKNQAEKRTMSEAERRLFAEESGCDSLIASKTSEADTIEARIAELSEEPGHGKEIANLTRQLTRLESDVREQTSRKAWLANQREQVATKAKEPVDDRKLANGAPLSGFTPRLQKWFEDHPKCFTDARYLRAAIRLSEDAADEGHGSGTEDNFRYVEERLPDARRQAPAGEEDRPTADSPYSRTAPPSNPEGEELEYTARAPQKPAAGKGSLAMPPSRTAMTSQSRQTGTRKPMLTAEQREVADNLYAHIPNLNERYTKYAEARQFMEDRRANNQHFQ
ncbi:MAG TPA: hypothetical protein VGG45_16220 [Terracidiphilus sp.]